MRQTGYATDDLRSILCNGLSYFVKPVYTPIKGEVGQLAVRCTGGDRASCVSVAEGVNFEVVVGEG